MSLEVFGVQTLDSVRLWSAGWSMEIAWWRRLLTSVLESRPA